METFIPEYHLGIDFSQIKNIYLAQKPADLRKGIDGYASIVQACMNLDPTDGSLFLFTNRQKNKMKGILYDGCGYWLLYKRMAGGSVIWPVGSDESDYIRITHAQLKSLLGGLSIMPAPSFTPRKPRYV